VKTMSKKIQTLAGQKFYTVSWTVKVSVEVMAENPRDAIALAEDLGETDANTRYTEKRAKLMTADEAEKTGKYAADGGHSLFRTEAAKVDAVTEFVQARRASDGLSDKLRDLVDTSIPLHHWEQKYERAEADRRFSGS
jgi:hypothetical protein